MKKYLSFDAASLLLITLLLISSFAALVSNPVSALVNDMTFTSGETIDFTSSVEMQFWSGVSMTFGTNIMIQFVEVFNGNGWLEPCDVIQILYPQGYLPPSCSWWEVFDPMGIPLGEFHVDQAYSPTEIHVDQVWPGPFPLPPLPITAVKKVDVIEPCQYYDVHYPAGWYPPTCSWWEILDPETGHATGFEFHVDWTNESCEFHIDEMIPGPYMLPFPYYEVVARKKIVEIKPCDWFLILDPAGFIPDPCTWWEIMYQGQPTGLEFHIDVVPGDGSFHVDLTSPDQTLAIPPTYALVVRQKINVIQECEWFKVADLSTTPKPCTWWKITNPDFGDVEFHVDIANQDGTFHIDVAPTIQIPPTYILTAEKKIQSLGPCDWFTVLNMQGWTPEPCSWWRIVSPAEWAGVVFHVDSTDGISKFHIDAADALPPGPTIPPWSVTAERFEPPSGQWYVKPAHPDYAPSGMPDFDEKQDMWGPAEGIYTWCGPVAVANSLWWLDSEYESLYNQNPVAPPTVSDSFPLVQAMGPWDDHDAQNVDPLVRMLAWFMDTDGQMSGDGHIGTRWQDMQFGIQQYLMQMGLDGMFEAHNATYPEFEWIESEVERCQDVELLLEFWQFTGGEWVKLYDNPSLEWGHYVTCAGVNSTSLELLISDPYQDAFESGADPIGRSPVPHVYPHPSSVHNDAQFVSQDAYQVMQWVAVPPFPYPTGVIWELSGYLQTMGYDPSWHAFITAAVATSPTGVHDVAVTNVTTCKHGCTPMPTVGRGYNAKTNVTVENQGTVAETFSVTLYVNDTGIETQDVVGLAPATSVVLTFTWNTSGYAIDYYEIKATATVPGDIDPGDNTYTDPELIRVVIIGDINGDDYVELMDFYVASQAFGSTIGGPRWNPNADIASWPDGDGFIELMDFFVLSQHFGDHYP